MKRAIQGTEIRCRGIHSIQSTLHDLISRREVETVSHRFLGVGTPQVKCLLLIIRNCAKLLTKTLQLLLLGSIDVLGLPARAERFIEKGANDVLDISKIKYELYGDGRDVKMRNVMQEEESDNQNSANRQEQKVWSSEKSNSFSNDSHNEKKYNQEEDKGLFHWDHKVLPDGKEQYTSFDPLGQSVKLYEKLYRAVPLLHKGFSTDADTTNSTSMQKYLNLAPDKASQTSVVSPELNQSMKDLSNQLRLNTSATTKMTNSFQQSKSSNNTPTVNINATATFN